jgi:hypothetical protein
VRHILFLADEHDDHDDHDEMEETLRTKEEAERLAWDVVARIAEGEDMVELVQELSEDTDLSNEGIYSFTREDGFEPGFLDWTFDDSRTIGEVGVCETTYGYHVMRLEDMSFTPFEEVRPDIEYDIKTEEVTKIKDAWKNDPKFKLQTNERVYNSLVNTLY